MAWIHISSDRDRIENPVDNTKEKMYSIGTIVRIEKKYFNLNPVDISSEGIYGYITDAEEYNDSTMAVGQHLYRIYVFKDRKEYRKWHNHISPVTEIE